MTWLADVWERVVLRVTQPTRHRLKEYLPDFQVILNNNNQLWKKAKARSTNGPRVLMATTVGGLIPSSTVESMLTIALTLRGANVRSLLCDRTLPACLNIQNTDTSETVIENYGLKKTRCINCYWCGSYLYKPLGLTNYRLSQYLTNEDKVKARKIANEIPFQDIPNYQLNNCNIGEHSYAGALRYYASGHLEGEAKGEMMVRRYLESGLLTAWGSSRLIKKHDISIACFNHGIYSPHGIIGEVCRNNQVRVVNWNAAYRKHCFIFSHDDTYHHTMMSEPTEIWEHMNWNAKTESEIVNYLKSRWNNQGDWIWFNDKPDEEFMKFSDEMGIDRNKPLIGMLTNVMWDAQLHYPANVFPNMLTWVVETIKYFETRPDLQLLIRIHPAEITGFLRSRQPLLTEIQKIWLELPKNVFVITPRNKMSTYVAMQECDSVIIYGTKTGVELTSVGIPVIVAGEAWIRGKNITSDPQSVQEYFHCLEQLPLGKRLDREIMNRARKYAYHFFFRRMLPLKFIEPSSGMFPYKININSLEELLPGVHPGLDIICDGIMKGKPFIYPAETIGL